MAKNKQRELYKVFSVVFLILAIAAGCVYFYFATNDDAIRMSTAYSTKVNKVSDNKYTMDYQFIIDGKKFDETFEYTTEPMPGKTEVVYYVSTNNSKVYKDKADINLYKEYMVIAIAAGGLLLLSLISFVAMKKIAIRKAYTKTNKRAKVSQDQILK